MVTIPHTIVSDIQVITNSIILHCLFMGVANDTIYRNFHHYLNMNIMSCSDDYCYFSYGRFGNCFDFVLYRYLSVNCCSIDCIVSFSTTFNVGDLSSLSISGTYFLML